MSVKSLAIGVAKKAASPIMKAGRKLSYKFGKKAPTILLVGGMGGMFASGVLIVVKSRKAAKALDDFTDARGSIEDLVDSKAQVAVMDEMDPGKYSAEQLEVMLDEQRKAIRKEYKGEIRHLYFDTGIKLVKIYIVPVGLGVVSGGLILGSHRILTKRLAGAVALYKASDEAFKEYRQRVIEDQGEDKDFEYRYGVKEREFEGVETDSKGKEKKVTEKRKIAGSGNGFEIKYCRETSPGYTGNEEYDMSILEISQNCRTNDLSEGKRVFVNDVLSDLGMAKLYPFGQTAELVYPANYHVRRAYEPVVKDGVHLAEGGKARFEAVYYLDIDYKMLYDEEEKPKKEKKNA